MGALLAGLVTSAATHPALAQEVLLQEGFNTDGEAATPKRYTMTGRDLYEPPRIRNELNNFDQRGPIYWEHSFNVSFTGNPNIPARRAIYAWRGTDTSAATEDFLALWDTTVAWLLDGKRNATVVVHPTAAAIGGLADRLTALGHTVVDDDTAVGNDADLTGDLFIHGPAASNPSRFVLLPKPVIVMNAPDYDDMLVGSIGSSVTFDPGSATIRATGHPAAGGKTGTFSAFTTGGQVFELIGNFLPTNALTVATITRIVPPAVNNLADVDAMIAGTKSHDQTAGQVTGLDFSDGSVGQWFLDNPVPGNYTANWGLRVTGTLSVTTAGTYRIAVGSDDGARLRIDLDKNGLSGTDTVVEDAGPHAHQIVYANITFPATGTFDFEVISYNSGGGGSLEVSVSTVPAAEVADDNLDSGFWELLGTDGAVSAVRLQGSANATGYVATGANVERQEPFIVLLNGPTETPPGAFYDGGPFSNFEGTGFLGGSGLNKWAYPDGQNYRSVRLNPVDVTGKQNVHLTVALAATVVDFETSDFIDIVIYPDGETSTPVTLAHFRGVQDAVQPWLADERQSFVRRLTRQFADFTYDIPSTARRLIVEIRAATSWWTEIVAIDNIRLTAGAASTPPTFGTASVSGGNITLTWTGGQGPFLIQWSPTLPGTWVNILTTSANSAAVPQTGVTGFFRVQSAATATVQLYKATVNGANEVPVVATGASGSAVLALEGNKLSYYVSYAGLQAAATAAHIHGPASTTESAGVLFPLTAATPLGTSGVLAGTKDLTASELDAIQNGRTYVNIHTGAFPGGEIRGQVVRVP